MRLTYQTGGGKVVDTARLRKKVEESGMTYKHIASVIGITVQALRLKINNQNEFVASEIVKISEILKLSRSERDAIFFNKPRE